MVFDAGFRKMSNPAQFSLFDLDLHWDLSCFFPQVFIGYNLWPSDVGHVSKTSVGECLEFVGVGLGHSPRF